MGVKETEGCRLVSLSFYVLISYLKRRKDACAALVSSAITNTLDAILLRVVDGTHVPSCIRAECSLYKNYDSLYFTHTGVFAHAWLRLSFTGMGLSEPGRNVVSISFQQGDKSQAFLGDTELSL